MSGPVVSSGSSHSDAVSAGMRKARELRDRYFDAIVSGEMSFNRAVEASKTDEFKALSRIKLIDVLSKRPGWSIPTASEALIHNGFSVNDRIVNVRNNRSKIESFHALMTTGPDRWKPRPNFPNGWPFFGKLSAAIAVDNHFDAIPDELVEMAEEDSGSSDRQTGAVDLIGDLMAGDDGDDDPDMIDLNYLIVEE